MQTLCYYYKKSLQPFRSITELSDTEIIDFMKANLPEEDFFHKNPEAYIRRRRETELWLHESFCRMGGKPMTTHPVYMTLGSSSYIESLGLYTKCLRVPLSLFPENAVSFTYPDSYVSRWLADTASDYFNSEIHGRVFTLSDLPFLLGDKTNHTDAWKNPERKYDFFIETQIWDASPLQRFKVDQHTLEYPAEGMNHL